jgi:hypothetical protein
MDDNHRGIFLKETLKVVTERTTELQIFIDDLRLGHPFLIIDRYLTRLNSFVSGTCEKDYIPFCSKKLQIL